MKKNNFKIIELKPEKNKGSVKRSVFIKDFIIQEIIGIHEHEKIKKQKIKFNIVIDIDQNTVLLIEFLFFLGLSSIILKLFFFIFLIPR